MKDYTVLYRQNLMDIALQELGSVEGILILAIDNNLSITADLEIGQIIKIDTTKIIDKKVVEYYKNNNIIIATDIPRPNRSQTITFASLGNLEIGDVVTLNAVASSGLVVLYFSSNPSVAVVENNTLTVIGDGNVTITASQVGDSIFYPISTSQTITIDVLLDIYYGFPTSFRDAIAYRFNGKDAENFALRIDGANEFVTNYTDPISTKVVAQVTASLQPKLVAGGVYFDGVDDNLNNLTSGLNDIREAWAVATYDLALAKNFDAILSIHDVIPNFSGFLVLNDGTANLVGSTTKVNNISTNIFLPATTKKTASYTFATFSITPSQLYIGQDRGVAGRNWQGQISDVILFNRVLTEPERAELQTYLQTFHSFTP